MSLLLGSITVPASRYRGPQSEMAPRRIIAAHSLRCRGRCHHSCSTRACCRPICSRPRSLPVSFRRAMSSMRCSPPATRSGRCGGPGGRPPNRTGPMARSVRGLPAKAEEPKIPAASLAPSRAVTFDLSQGAHPKASRQLRQTAAPGNSHRHERRHPGGKRFANELLMRPQPALRVRLGCTWSPGYIFYNAAPAKAGAHPSNAR
jgi:hypothetical protein